MKKRLGLALCALLCVIHAPAARAITTLSAVADRSLAIPLSLIAREYSRKHETTVSFSFSLNHDELKKIAEGSAGDVLITAHDDWIESLRTQGLVDVYSQVALARNRLALAVPQDNVLAINLDNGLDTAALLASLGHDHEPVIAVGNPDALLEGKRAVEALHGMHAMEALAPSIAYVQQASDLAQKVHTQQAAALMLYTDVIHAQGLRVAAIFPDNRYTPIAYNAVVIAGDRMNAARDFLEYMKSPTAKEIFRKNGFLPEE